MPPKPFPALSRSSSSSSGSLPPAPTPPPTNTTSSSSTSSSGSSLPNVGIGALVLTAGVGAAAAYYLYTRQAQPGPEPGPRKKVVIVGGGIAGAQAAKLLEDVADVTLIDEKDYVEVRWAIPRMVVDPEVANKALIIHKEYLKSATVVVGKATRITKDTVVTETRGDYPYDYLILATGMGHAKEGPAPWHEAATKEEQIELYKEGRKELDEATSILVVGGGPVGCELAAEIVSEFPGKKVTIVQSGPRLVEVAHELTSAKVEEWLKAKGVEVILNDKVGADALSVNKSKGGEAAPPPTTSSMFRLLSPRRTPESSPRATDVPAAENELTPPSLKTCRTKNGVQIQTDYVLITAGAKPAAASFKEGLFADVVDEKGALKVGEDMRVLGFENIFAVGDVVDIVEPKQAVAAESHAHIAAANITSLIKAKPEGAAPSMLTYKPPPPSEVMMIVSLGRNDGVLQGGPNNVVTGFMPAAIKSRDMLVSKYRGDLGLYAPGPLAISSTLGFGASVLKGLVPMLSPYLG